MPDVTIKTKPELVFNEKNFYAIDISNEARRRVAEYAETLRREFPHLRIGWEKPEKLHLTLKFLGETNENQLEKLDSIIENIASEISSFKLEIANTGIFPSVKNARILWIDVIYAWFEQNVLHARTEMVELFSNIENECVKIGFPPKHRNFKPHLTIARLREPPKSGEVAQKHLENKFEPVEFEVSEIVIYESKLQPTGSIYSVVSKHKLN